ncbi:MAG: hypothetical protein ACI9C4_003057, partial [Paraglaciecola sp.]
CRHSGRFARALTEILCVECQARATKSIITSVI